MTEWIFKVWVLGSYQTRLKDCEGRGSFLCQFKPLRKANLDPRELYDLSRTKQGKITKNMFFEMVCVEL